MNLPKSAFLLAKLCLVCNLIAGEVVGQEQGDGSPVVARSPRGLPAVPSVESMTGASASLEKTLARTPAQSAFDQAAKMPENGVRTTKSELADAEWEPGCASWTAAQFHTNPLYFEQINFERYQTNVPAWTRPAISYAKFIGTIPVLPYKIGEHGPRERMYTIGHHPEGQLPSRKSHAGLSPRGVLYQGAATTGLIFVVP